MSTFLESYEPSEIAQGPRCVKHDLYTESPHAFRLQIFCGEDVVFFTFFLEYRYFLQVSLMKQGYAEIDRFLLCELPF